MNPAPVVVFANRHWILLSEGKKGVEKVRQDLKRRYNLQMHMLDRIENDEDGTFNPFDASHVNAFVLKIKEYSLPDLHFLYDFGIQQNVSPSNLYMAIIKTRIQHIS